MVNRNNEIVLVVMMFIFGFGSLILKEYLHKLPGTISLAISILSGIGLIFINARNNKKEWEELRLR